MDSEWPYTCDVHDILSGPVEGIFDAAYSLDVLEHISANKERKFISNINESLSADGVLIIGMPS